jgi:hypothetical protein
MMPKRRRLEEINSSSSPPLLLLLTIYSEHSKRAIYVKVCELESRFLHAKRERD